MTSVLHLAPEAIIPVAWCCEKDEPLRERIKVQKRRYPFLAQLYNILSSIYTYALKELAQKETSLFQIWKKKIWLPASEASQNIGMWVFLDKEDKKDMNLKISS